MKKFIPPVIILFFILFLPDRIQVFAEELTPVIVSDSRKHTITVTAEGGGAIGAVYIKWDDPVVPYQIKTDSETIDCGEHGFLHEFIPLMEKSETLTVLLPEEQMRLYQNEVRIFTDETVPEDVQIWQPPCDRADIMLIPSHSDDEILYMGGIAPTYGAESGAEVQVVYMTEFWTTNRVREHEKLDGLWTDGVRNYPVCANFRDVYAADLEQAMKLYDYQEVTDYLTDVIRRFQPQVVVTHDFEGEYGHGFHKLTAKAVAEALEYAGDSAYRTDSESFLNYGAWDTPKAYFHLYEENKIRLDLRIPLESMGGQTALEAAVSAYDKHVSQHIYSFFVSDDYKHSCAEFGLYRTKVGFDTGNNMLEHIVLYSEQERLERERLEREEQERIESEEQERQEKEEQERLEQERLEQERIESEEQERIKREEILAEETAYQMQRIAVIAAAVIVLAVPAACFIRKEIRKKRK